MNEKGKTYVILCSRGLIKSQCPLVQQKGWHCAECSYARYIKRQRPQFEEQTENESENQTENES